MKLHQSYKSVSILTWVLNNHSKSKYIRNIISRISELYVNKSLLHLWDMRLLIIVTANTMCSLTHPYLHFRKRLQSWKFDFICTWCHITHCPHTGSVNVQSVLLYKSLSAKRHGRCHWGQSENLFMNKYFLSCLILLTE
jgi:hypothetical protein